MVLKEDVSSRFLSLEKKWVEDYDDERPGISQSLKVFLPSFFEREERLYILSSFCFMAFLIK
jgi:hypothetical protein